MANHQFTPLEIIPSTLHLTTIISLSQTKMTNLIKKLKLLEGIAKVFAPLSTSKWVFHLPTTTNGT